LRRHLAGRATNRGSREIRCKTKSGSKKPKPPFVVVPLGQIDAEVSVEAAAAPAWDDKEQWRSALSKSGDAEVSSSGLDVLEASVVASRGQGRAPL
jgi:hypothetical protein